MFSYRAILRQAWEITWQYKYLWFFGLFAAIVASGGAWEYQLLSQNLNQGLTDASTYRVGGLLAAGTIARELFLGLANLFRYDFLTIINGLTILIVAGVLIFSFIWLAIASQAALVNDFKRILLAKKRLPALGIREGFARSHHSFWTLLGLNILIKLLVAFSFFLISLPLLFLTFSDTSGLRFAYSLLFIIFIPLAMSLSLLVKYAICYVVLDGRAGMAALEDGFRLFRRNWLVSLEMAVILFLINFALSAVILIGLSLFTLPIFLWGLIFDSIGLQLLAICLALVLILFLGSALTAFQVSSWTNLYLHLRDKSGLAKLERVFSRR